MKQKCYKNNKEIEKVVKNTTVLKFLFHLHCVYYEFKQKKKQIKYFKQTLKGSFIFLEIYTIEQKRNPLKT